MDSLIGEVTIDAGVDSMFVELFLELFEFLLEIPLVPQEEPVKILPAHCFDDAFHKS